MAERKGTMSVTAVRTLAITAALLGLGACATSDNPDRSFIAASLEARSGSAVAGTVRVTRHRLRIHLRATVSGLDPGSEHGFHLHEKGDCSAPDASSAGGHFNPTGSTHGKHDAAAHHAGDLPSLKANSKGVARVDVDLTGLVWDGAQGLKGRAVIVHAKPDDFTTQPSGNAGARVACAVIG
jgi:superoxide dismutase, Cu-Zn family